MGALRAGALVAVALAVTLVSPGVGAAKAGADAEPSVEPRDPYEGSAEAERREGTDKSERGDTREGEEAREAYHSARKRDRARRGGHPPVENERSTRAAYGIAAASTIAPFFVADYAARRADDGSDAWSHVVGVSALAALAWGPSTGYFYSGNTRYALIGGLGRSALIGGTMLYGRYQTEGGQPYLAVMSLGALATWGIVDFAYLSHDVRRQNRRRRAEAASSPPVSVSLSPDPLGLTISGSF